MNAKNKKPVGVAAVPAFEGAAALLALAAPGTVAPSENVKARLLARIRLAQTAAVAPPPAGFRFESAKAAEGWKSGIPGVRIKILSVDETRDVAMLLVEMAPGARFPDHFHDAGSDEGILISGDVVTGGRLLRAGDYYRAEEKTEHTDTVSPHGCTALVSLTARAWNKWRELFSAP